MRNIVVITLVMALFFWPVQAQDYTISFRGVGASEIIDSINVENITQGTSITIGGSESLELKAAIMTGFRLPGSELGNSLLIYPNPCYENAFLEFTPACPGETIIDIFDLSGKFIFRESFEVDKSPQKLILSGVQQGIFFINVTGRTYKYSGKLISINSGFGNLRLERLTLAAINTDLMEEVEKKEAKGGSKGQHDDTAFSFNEGDRLKFTGHSGIYKTIVMAEAVSDTTITFEFVECTDGDNNNYAVVKIGAQTWMAENLRSTSFNTGEKIPNVSDGTVWQTTTSPAYCFYNNQQEYGEKYGALYNWPVVETEKICPIGWHIQDTSDVFVLFNYLGKNGYSIDSSENTAKSLASTSGWEKAIDIGTVGYDQTNNNKSGFTANPGGIRTSEGYFIKINQLDSWWLSTEKNLLLAFTWIINFNESNSDLSDWLKQTGNHIRCIKNSDDYWSRYFSREIFQDGDAFDNGKLIINFDDGFADNYTNGLPVLKEKGATATIYIPTTFVGSPGYLTWEQLKEMAIAGVDLQCHGHVTGNISRFSEANITNEYEGNNFAFTSNNMIPRQHTAYSNSDHSEQMIEIVANYRKTGRMVKDQYITRKVNKYEIPGTSLPIALKTTKVMLDAVKRDKTAIILYSHQVPAGGEYLGQIIDYSKQIGLDIISMKQFYELLLYIDIQIIQSDDATRVDLICPNRLKNLAMISIERSEDGGIFKEIATLAPGINKYSDIGLDPTKSYRYRARGLKNAQYLPYSRVAEVTPPISLTLTATGTGIGVSTLIISSIEEQTLTLSGSAKFYTDAAGTLNESTQIRILSGGEVHTTIYIRVPSGSSILHIPKAGKVTRLKWSGNVDTPSLAGDVSNLTSLMYLEILGNNSLMGSITNFKDLKSLHISGDNTITGEITHLLMLNNVNINGAGAAIMGDVTKLELLITLSVSCANCRISGDITRLTFLSTLVVTEPTTTIHGDVTGLTSLIWITLLGQNTLSGSITNLINLTHLLVTGNNTLNGNIIGLTKLTYLNVTGNNTIVGI